MWLLLLILYDFLRWRHRRLLILQTMAPPSLPEQDDSRRDPSEIRDRARQLWANNGQPSDTNLTRLREAVAPLLLHNLYDETGGNHKLVVLIWSKLAYVARYGKALPEPKRVEAHDIDIDDKNTTVVCTRREVAHKARCADRATFKTNRLTYLDC